MKNALPNSDMAAGIETGCFRTKPHINRVMKMNIITINKMKKILLIIISLMIFAGSLLAQTNYGPWILLQEQDNVKIHRSYSSCEGELRILLKIENTGASDITVSFDSAFNLDGTVFETDHSLQFTIPAGTTLGGNCANQGLSVNPYEYVTSIQLGVSDYIVQNLQIVQL